MKALKDIWIVVDYYGDKFVFDDKADAVHAYNRWTDNGNWEHADEVSAPAHYKLCEAEAPQELQRGTMVSVADVLPSYMSHFQSGFKAVVESSYVRWFGGSNYNDYSLLMLDEDGVVVGSTAWYGGELLTPLPIDIEVGIAILDKAKEDHRRNDDPLTDEHYSQIAKDVVEMEALRAKFTAVQRELKEGL